MGLSRAIILSVLLFLVDSQASAQPAPSPVGITFAKGGALATSAVSYVHGGADTNEANQSFIYPVDVVLRNLSTICKLGADPGPLPSGSFELDLTANSANTGIQTVCDTSTWIAHDTAHSSATVSAGEFVTLKSTPASTPFVNTQLFASWQTFDTDGVTPLVFLDGGGTLSTPGNGQYCDVMKGSCNFASASLAARVLATPVTVDRFAVTLGSAPTSANTETYCLRNVSTATDIVCTPALTSPRRTAISPECTANCTVSAGDELAIRVDLSGSGRSTNRHFAIHVTGATTQILYGGTPRGTIDAAGPIGVDFTTSAHFAVFPVATGIKVRNLYAVADSNVTQTIRIAASANCDNPASGSPRPSCVLSNNTACADASSSFDLHGIGCLRVEHKPGGTINVRIRGGVELSQGPPDCPSDCNGDDLVTAQEAVSAIEIALGLNPLSGCQNADANQDDVVTIEDLVRGLIGVCAAPAFAGN